MAGPVWRVPRLEYAIRNPFEWPASNSASVRSTGRSGYAGTTASVQRLEDVAVVDLPRLRSGFDEFDRVWAAALCRVPAY